MSEMSERSVGWTGRADYEERREARIDRLRERAEAHGRASMEAGERAHAAVAGIPFGQPNIHGALTGAIRRSQAATERSIREAEAAGYAADAADAAELNTAISSDDPAAIEKLKAKMAKLEKVRDAMKEANKLCRGKDRAAAEAKLVELGVAEEDRKDMLDGRIKGFPGWMLSGTTANIARLRKRIEELESRASEAAPAGWAFEGGKVVVNVDANRLQVVFDERADEETVGRLKANGFHWSRWERAWQRQLNPRSVGCARMMFPAVVAEGGAE